MARFVLMHLTPAARNAFRAYRDAHQACTKAGKVMDTAWQIHVAYKQSADHVTAAAGQPGEWMAAKLASSAEAHQRAEARWQATVDRAQAAADFAVPLLTAEGYPFGWWCTGTMRLPQGVTSPGADRLVRR